ncbi:MAG TPA: ABC transporter permease [Vicinamibacteria bacterium]|nr:ABC transporter permease [Vicinamibacteria bacterium]
MIVQLRALLRYRPLIRSLVSRELKARYRGSVLGFFWSFINPLLLLVTYGIVFIYILPARRSPAMEPYLLFFACGILPWTWFQSSLAEASGVLIAGGNLIKKVLFPAEVLPVVTVCTNLVQMLLALPVLAVFLLYHGRLAPAAVLVVLPIAVQLVFVLGLALFVSSLTVHFRDIQSILGHLLHVWFFATPVLYAYADLGPRMKAILRFNPMTHVVVSYQQTLFEGRFDHWRGLGAAAVVAVATYAVGAWLFDRLRDTLAEEV